MRVIIIGASSGLGKIIAREYIARGYTVGLAARRLDVLTALAEGRGNVLCERMDIRQTAESVSVLDRLIHRIGGLDLLILCSGIGAMNPDLNAEIEADTIATNVAGWTAIVDRAFSFFTNQGHGHLAAISSIAGLRGLGPAPSYSASKAYQSHYLEALSQRARRSRQPLYVTDIRPGFIRTPLLNHPEAFFWVEDAEKACREIVRAIDRRLPLRTVTRRWRLLVPLMKAVPNSIIAKIIYRK